MKSIHYVAVSAFILLASCQRENLTPQNTLADAQSSGSARASASSVQTEISIVGNGVIATAHQTATNLFPAGRLESIKGLVSQAGAQINSGGFKGGIPKEIKGVKIDFWAGRNNYTISSDGKSISGMPEAGTNTLFKAMLKAYYLREWTSSSIPKQAYNIHKGSYSSVEDCFAQTVYAYTIGDPYQAPYNKAYIEKNMPYMARFIENQLMK